MEATDFLAAFEKRCEIKNINELTVDPNANRGAKHTSHGKYLQCPKCGADVTDYIEKPCGYNQRLSAWWKDKVEVDWKKRKYLTI